MAGRTLSLAFALRLALLAATVWLCVGPPAGAVLAALQPAQRSVFAALLPEHEVRSFGVEQRGAHLVLQAATVTTRYVVVRGLAYEPGVRFSAQTPARAASTWLMLIVGGAVLIVRPHGAAGAALAGGVVTAAAASMAIVAPALLLAGAQWGVAMRAFEEFTAPALLVAASDLLVHGGGYALCAVAVALAASASAHKPFRPHRVPPNAAA